MFCLVSDHGGTPTTFRVTDVNRVLEGAGLLTYKDGGGRRGEIDWSKTKVAGQGVVNLFVNLEGREPTGIVKPQDYEQVRRRRSRPRWPTAIRWRGTPFVFALRREDAEAVNMWGDLVGDLVYATLPEFDGAHGHQLPSAKWGWGSQHTLFVLSGAGVKPGTQLSARCARWDAAPTPAYLTGLPTPAESEGRVDGGPGAAGLAPQVASPSSAARARCCARSGALRGIDAARCNSARASSVRPSRARRSPRTLCRRW